MKLYCENCGKRLKVIRKAIPKIGAIIDLVSYHECSEEPVPFDFNPDVIIDAAPVDGKQKFVKSLNELARPISMKVGAAHSEGKSLRPSSMTGTDDLRDRRFDPDLKTKSSAPSSVLDQIKQIGNSIPSHDLKDDTSDSEMGG